MEALLSLLVAAAATAVTLFWKPPKHARPPRKMVAAIVSVIVFLVFGFLGYSISINSSLFRYQPMIDSAPMIVSAPTVESVISDMIRTGDIQFANHEYANAEETYNRALQLIFPIVADENDPRAVRLRATRSEVEVKKDLATIGVLRGESAIEQRTSRF